MRMYLQNLGLIGITILNLSLSAQELSRWVISAGGSHHMMDQISLSATMGQSGLAGILENQSLTITAGFQQMEEFLPTSILDEQNEVTVAVYPNPFTDQFVLALEIHSSAKLDYVLYDIHGKIIFDKHNIDLNAMVHQEIINTPYLASGVYDLLVTMHDKNGKILRYSFPVVKNR